MQSILSCTKTLFILCCLSPFALTSCANRSYSGYGDSSSYYQADYSDYSSRIPERMETKGERLVLIDPNVHVWGAYDRDGSLVRSGLATAGGDWCPDTGRSCRTSTGTFRIYSLGDGRCISRRYPLPRGGGLMPYCMYFSNGMALHGSPDGTVVAANISHGCVRMRIPDAEWLRYNFVSIGTKVRVEPY